jgi:hypothetical protein
MWTNRNLFLQIGLQKMLAPVHLNFMFGRRLVSRIPVPYCIWRIPTIRNRNQNFAVPSTFSSYKSVRIGRIDSIQAACRRMLRLEAFLYLAAQNFKLFFQHLKSKTYCG